MEMFMKGIKKNNIIIIIFFTLGNI